MYWCLSSRSQSGGVHLRSRGQLTVMQAQVRQPGVGCDSMSGSSQGGLHSRRLQAASAAAKVTHAYQLGTGMHTDRQPSAPRALGTSRLWQASGTGRDSVSP
jgi:hypothetical protein